MDSISLPDFIRVGFNLEVFNGSQGFFDESTCAIILEVGFLQQKNGYST